MKVDLDKNGWPKSVLVRDTIGHDSYWRGRSPVCAIGCMEQELFGRPAISPGKTYQSHSLQFRYAYRAVASADLGSRVYLSVEETNDMTSEDKRPLYYNASWALLGYTEGQSEEALKLARKAKRYLKNNPDWNIK